MTRCLLLLFLFTCEILRSEIPCKPNFNPEQTKSEIKRLTTGNDQRMRKTYRHGVLFSEEWHQDWPIRYMKYYYQNGRLHSEGLMDFYQNIGTWHYFDSTGKLLKTADYNTMTQKLTKGYSEPGVVLLEQMSAKADSFMYSHFSMGFIDSFHVECEHKYYNVTGEIGALEWMDLPLGDPTEFSFSYTMRINDSLTFDLMYFRFASDGTFSQVLYGAPPCTEPDQTCRFNVSIERAIGIAREYSFNATGLPELRYDDHGYRWNFYGPSVGTANHSWNKVLSIDVESAQVDTFTQESYCDHCEPVVFKKYYKDSSIFASGYKRINAEGIYINVPETWIELEEYGKTSEYSSTTQWFDKTDTLFLRTSSGHEARIEKLVLQKLSYDLELYAPKFAIMHMPHKMMCIDGDVACQRQADSLFAIDSMRVVHYNDSMQLVYEKIVARNKAYVDSIQEVQRLREIRALRKERLEDSLSLTFVAGFPDTMMQGRPVKMYVSSPSDYNPTWSISMTVNNPHGGYGVMQTNYYFSANYLTEEQFYRFYEIFKTARFLSYK